MRCGCVAVLQDVSGGRPVAVQAGDLPLWGMQIDVAAAADEIRGIGREADGGVSAADEFLSGIGLGAIAEQLKDLRLSAHPVVAHSPNLEVLSCFGMHTSRVEQGSAVRCSHPFAAAICAKMLQLYCLISFLCRALSAAAGLWPCCRCSVRVRLKTVCLLSLLPLHRRVSASQPQNRRWYPSHH